MRPALKGVRSATPNRLIRAMLPNLSRAFCLCCRFLISLCALRCRLDIEASPPAGAATRRVFFKAALYKIKTDLAIFPLGPQQFPHI